MKHTRKNKDDSKGAKLDAARKWKGCSRRCGKRCSYCEANRKFGVTKSQVISSENLKAERLKAAQVNIENPKFHKEPNLWWLKGKGDWCGNGMGYSHSDFGWRDDTCRKYDTGKETFQNPNGFRRLPIIRCASCGVRVRLRMRMSGYPDCCHDPYLVVPPHKIKKVDRNR